MTPEKLLLNRIPREYDDACVLMREVGQRLFDRLQWMTLQPKVIADLGCNLGDCSRLAKSLYSDADVISIDSDLIMLEYTKKNVRMPLNANLTTLPLRNQSVDLIIANLQLGWCSSVEATLAEWQRILQPASLVMFTCFGPATLQEFRSELIEMPNLIDMHNIGDALIYAGLMNPVLDVEYFTLTYKNIEKLFHEMKILGMFEGDHTQVHLSPNDQGIFEVTFEIVYGHAWARAITPNPIDGSKEVRIPLSQILNRKKS